MRNILIATYCLSGILLLAACGSENNQTEETTATNTETTGTPVVGGDSTLTDEQRNLFEQIARHNQFQIELGRLAAERGVSDDVKQYGQRMVDLQTTKQQEIQEMAQTFGITLEQGINEDLRDDIDEVTKAEQGKFDETYWENVTDAQEDLLGEYDNVLKSVDETDAGPFYIWARPSMKELRAQMEQAMASAQELRAN